MLNQLWFSFFLLYGFIWFYYITFALYCQAIWYMFYWFYQNVNNCLCDFVRTLPSVGLLKRPLRVPFAIPNAFIVLCCGISKSPSRSPWAFKGKPLAFIGKYFSRESAQSAHTDSSPSQNHITGSTEYQKWGENFFFLRGRKNFSFLTKVILTFRFPCAISSSRSRKIRYNHF